MDQGVCSLREMKFAEDDGAMTFSGYGAVFDNLDHHGDVIAPGAFRKSLRQAKASGVWPAMLAQHGSFLGGDENMPIGVWTSFEEDDVGLKVEGRLAETTRGRDAYALLKMQPRPALDGLSIGYLVKQAVMGTRPEEPRRTLKEVDLLEVSLVTFPANPKARVVDVKARDGLTIRDAETALRDAGFSRSEAKAIVAKGFKALPQREADESDVTGALSRLVSKLSA